MEDESESAHDFPDKTHNEKEVRSVGRCFWKVYSLNGKKDGKMGLLMEERRETRDAGALKLGLETTKKRAVSV